MKIVLNLNFNIVLKSDVILLDLIFFEKRKDRFIDRINLGLIVFFDSFDLLEKFFFSLLGEVSDGLSSNLMDMVSSELFVVFFLNDFDELFLWPWEAPIEKHILNLLSGFRDFINPFVKNQRYFIDDVRGFGSFLFNELENLISACKEALFMFNATLTISIATYECVLLTVGVVACQIGLIAFDAVGFYVELACVLNLAWENALFCVWIHIQDNYSKNDWSFKFDQNCEFKIWSFRLTQLINHKKFTITKIF